MLNNLCRDEFGHPLDGEGRHTAIWSAEPASSGFDRDIPAQRPTNIRAVHQFSDVTGVCSVRFELLKLNHEHATRIAAELRV